MQEFYLDVDENVPLPNRASEAMPELTSKEEIDMRARTVKLLADMQGIAITPSDEDIEAAQEIAKQMVLDPQKKPEFSMYPNETMAYLAGLVSQYNCMIVKDLADLKLYVVNKLVAEIENSSNAKERITALKHLGEVDGVDAFKKRSEITHRVKPIEEVEQELLTVLDNIEYRVISETTEPVIEEVEPIEAVSE